MEALVYHHGLAELDLCFIIYNIFWLSFYKPVISDGDLVLLPVPLSAADIFRIPLASMSNMFVLNVVKVLKLQLE